MKKIGHFFLSFLKLTAGAFVYSLSIAFFLDPCIIVPGGISGLSILFNHTLGFPTGVINLVLNVPLLILGLIFLGKKFIFNTVYVTVISSLMIDWLEYLISGFPPLTENRLLAAVAGGTIMALGCGILMLSEGSSGGTEIIAKMLRKPFPQLKTGI